MSALLDTQKKVVVRIADSGSEPTYPSGLTVCAAKDDRVAQMLYQILADPKTVTVISLSGHPAIGQPPGALDFNGAMRLVEQECYQSA